MIDWRLPIHQSISVGCFTFARSGYLLKERPASEVAEAIRRVHSGLRVIDPALAAEAWNADEGPLSQRERQVLQRDGDGRSSAVDMPSQKHQSCTLLIFTANFCEDVNVECVLQLLPHKLIL
jgi:hypothetical protein